jgi:flavin-dependent dehydrogenase
MALKTLPDHVAVLGGGPAGSSVATRLAEKGSKVVIFHESQSPPISLGESLIPGVIPHLKELGVEGEIESFSQRKPGAVFHGERTIDFSFQDKNHTDLFPSYAYNVPREQFNQVLMDRAREKGVGVVDRRVELVSDGDRVVIPEEALKEADHPFDGQPDMVLDATGRGRAIPSLLDLPAEREDRNDVAFFTHYDRIPSTTEGNIHVNFLDGGWSWRIPLPDRVSFGLVMESSRIADGDDAEAQLDNTLREIPELRSMTRESQRLEPVLRFDVNHWKTNRTHGENWALVGDTAGFVDPILSSGLFVALETSRKLAEILESPRSNMEEYDQFVKHQLDVWDEVTDLFYNGRMMALFNAGQDVQDSLMGQLLNPVMEKHISRVVTGGITRSAFSMWLIRFMSQYGLMDHEPEDHAIKAS